MNKLLKTLSLVCKKMLLIKNVNLVTKNKKTRAWLKNNYYLLDFSK